MSTAARALALASAGWLCSCASEGAGPDEGVTPVGTSEQEQEHATVETTQRAVPVWLTSGAVRDIGAGAAVDSLRDARFGERLATRGVAVARAPEPAAEGDGHRDIAFGRASGPCGTGTHDYDSALVTPRAPVAITFVAVDADGARVSYVPELDRGFDTGLRDVRLSESRVEGVVGDRAGHFVVRDAITGADAELEVVTQEQMTDLRVAEDDAGSAEVADGAKRVQLVPSYRGREACTPLAEDLVLEVDTRDDCACAHDGRGGLVVAGAAPRCRVDVRAIRAGIVKELVVELAR